MIDTIAYSGSWVLFYGLLLVSALMMLRVSPHYSCWLMLIGGSAAAFVSILGVVAVIRHQDGFLIPPILVAGTWIRVDAILGHGGRLAFSVGLLLYVGSGFGRHVLRRGIGIDSDV